ncbi:MAG: hypothetical protein RBS57_14965, partial [Desulforhabdus sp.]|nr:hypothetical protein [Desulforhabdus sp.]
MESQSDFSGARRIPLVGQRPFLRVLETRVHNTGLNLFYLEGAGGIGKTFLLMTALEEWSVNEFCTARTIVDLYHLDAQSPEGFVRRVLDSFDQVLFPGTRTLLGKLDEARQEGNDRQVQEHLRELDNCFVNDINLLSATRPVILALDTLEVLVYTDEEQVQATVLDIGNWLLHDFLPKIQGNVIVLMAGRPSVWNQQLDSLIQQHPHIQTETFTVSALSEAESKEYLETIIAKYADPDATARLQAFSEEHSAALPLLTQGKPILLSLVADMVAQGSVLPLVFAEPLEKLRSLEPEKLQEIVRHALFDCLQASPSPVGETLRQLAWLRKGATPELLARLLRLKTPQGDWDITKATQYLDKVRILTFVKARSDDDRTFLHDELYALFDCYAPPYRSSEEQASVYGVIETYYDAQLGFLPSAQEMLPQVEAQRQQLHLERLHYLL